MIKEGFITQSIWKQWWNERKRLKERESEREREWKKAKKREKERMREILPSTKLDLLLPLHKYAMANY